VNIAPLIFIIKKHQLNDNALQQIAVIVRGYLEIPGGFNLAPRLGLGRALERYPATGSFFLIIKTKMIIKCFEIGMKIYDALYG